MQLGNTFSVYINIVMLLIGAYMSFVQSDDLVRINHLGREGRFSKIIGWFYIGFSVVGFAIMFLSR